MTLRVIFAALLITVAAPALAQNAQQTTPPPGSPAATITIPGDQLPPPPQKFGGKIERDAREGCRKQAEAKGLGVVDRVKFVQQCVQQ